METCGRTAEFLGCHGPRCVTPTPALRCRSMTDPRAPKETAPQDIIPRDAQRFRRTLVRVLAVQVVTLVLLWLLQGRYALVSP